MKNDEKRTIKWLCIFGIIPVVWLALLVAPFVSRGLMEIVSEFPAAIDNPFHIVLCEDSKKTVLVFLLAYAMTVGVAVSSRRNYRRGEEHGSAKWGDAGTVNRKYRAKNPEHNSCWHIRSDFSDKRSTGGESFCAGYIPGQEYQCRRWARSDWRMHWVRRQSLLLRLRRYHLPQAYPIQVHRAE